MAAVKFLKKLPTYSFETFSFADEAIQTSQTSHQPQTNLQRSIPTRPPTMSQIGRQPRIFPSKVQPKNLANIKFHAYYLEGGWGYVIVFCALLANILNQGTLFSTSIVASIADRRFRIGGGPQFGVYSGGKKGPRFHSVCDSQCGTFRILREINIGHIEAPKTYHFDCFSYFTFWIFWK